MPSKSLLFATILIIDCSTMLAFRARGGANQEVNLSLGDEPNIEMTTRAKTGQVWARVFGEQPSTKIETSTMEFYFNGPGKNWSVEVGPAKDILGPMADEGLARAIPELLTQVALRAPKTSGWYEAITEEECPATWDPGFQGVSFHMVYMMRRAGLNFYFEKMATQRSSQILHIPYNPSSNGPIRSITEHLVGEPYAQSTPELVRVVAISDTHGFHSNLKDLPDGDLLVHAGDLAFAEYDNQDGELFRSKISGFAENYSVDDFLSINPKWALVQVLEWFQSLKVGGSSSRSFEEIVIVGGNHDYILEQLGARRAKDLCLRYGIRYLHTRDAPTLVTVKGRSVTVWGTAMTNTKKVTEKQVAPSSNNAFQLPPNEHGQYEFNADVTAAMEATQNTDGVDWTPVDILVTHSPPVFQQKDIVVNWIDTLARKLKPSLHFYGHVHNKKESEVFSGDIDKVYSGVSSRAEYVANDNGKSTLNVWCPVLSGFWTVWGVPTVVDLPLTKSPTAALTEVPTEVPTEALAEAPTKLPTEAPTEAPTVTPTGAPTESPTLPLTGPVCCKCKAKNKSETWVYTCSKSGSCNYCEKYGGSAEADKVPAVGTCAAREGRKSSKVKACKAAFER